VRLLCKVDKLSFCSRLPSPGGHLQPLSALEQSQFPKRDLRIAVSSAREAYAWISNLNSQTIDYWVAYWIAAYKYVLSRRDSVILFSYEQMCLNAESELCDIFEQMNINPEGMLDSISTPSTNSGRPGRGGPFASRGCKGTPSRTSE
jgi:hypothetical protein